MKTELAGKKALLTGASSGIGRALAKALGKAGVALAVTARRADALQSLADEIEQAGGKRPIVLPSDLSQPGAAKELAARALAALGQVDILINNAGVGIGGAQHVVGDDEMARSLFETNYWTPLALVAALGPAMRDRGAGAIVNVTSIGAIAPMPLAGHYSSSKAALQLSTETMRLELGKSGVHIFAVLPGPVETAMLAEMRVVPGGARLLARMPRGNVDELAVKIVRGLERGQRTLVYPSSLGILRHLPSMMLRISESMTTGLIDVSDPRKMRGGSQGDTLALAARGAFDANA